MQPSEEDVRDGIINVPVLLWVQLSTKKDQGRGALTRYNPRITLLLNTTNDMVREVLKSDTVGVGIPDIDMDLGGGVI